MLMLQIWACKYNVLCYTHTYAPLHIHWLGDRSIGATSNNSSTSWKPSRNTQTNSTINCRFSHRWLRKLPESWMKWRFSNLIYLSYSLMVYKVLAVCVWHMHLSLLYSPHQEIWGHSYNILRQGLQPQETLSLPKDSWPGTRHREYGGMWAICLMCSDYCLSGFMFSKICICLDCIHHEILMSLFVFIVFTTKSSGLRDMFLAYASVLKWATPWGDDEILNWTDWGAARASHTGVCTFKALAQASMAHEIGSFVPLHMHGTLNREFCAAPYAWHMK